MNLTKGQAEADEMVGRLLQCEEPDYAIMTGWAGTGKTSLLKVFAEKYDPPLVLTPTGKAAVRVREATGLAAQTIHKYLYRVQEDPETGEPRWVKKPLELVDLPGNGLVVVDEASMVGRDLWVDLWTTCSRLGLRVLLVGDRFQLPPVARKENGDFKPWSCLTDLQPSYRVDLTEVVRQALDSPIIRASMALRTGADQAMEALVGLPDVRRDRLAEEFLDLDPDRALIAWRNATRHQLNREVREAMGFGDEVLRVGEPLLVLQNNYGLGRFNGEVVRFDGWRFSREPGTPEAVRDRFKSLSAFVSFGLADIEGADAVLSPEEVFGRSNGLSESCMARAGRRYACDVWRYEREFAPPHLNANLGYCLTAHKAQGSQWQDVMVLLEEGRGLATYEGRRWVYTSLTRACNRVKICWG